MAWLLYNHFRHRRLSLFNEFFSTIKWRLFLGTFMVCWLVGPSDSLSQASPENIGNLTPEQVERVFIRGIGYIREGEPEKAIYLFRQILARNPDLPRVRLELARAYFEIGSWSESRVEFVSVLSDDIPTAVRQNVLRFIKAIDARRGFDWSAAIGVSLSPEAGRRYKTDTVRLDFFGTELPFKVEREEKDVIGLTFEGSAEVRRKLLDVGAGPSIVGFVAGAADLFEAEGSKYDDYILNGTLGVRFVWPQTTAVAAANGSVRYKSGEIYEDKRGIRGSVEFRSETGFSPILAASYSLINVHGTDAQDGDLYNLGGGFSKSVLGRANVGAFVNLQHFNAEEPYESYQGIGVRVVGQADIGYGISVSARPNIEYRSYEERIPFFPDTREDMEFSVDAEVIKNDVFILGRFSPFIKVGYTHNKSAIDIFTYDEYRVSVGVKNAF